MVFYKNHQNIGSNASASIAMPPEASKTYFKLSLSSEQYFHQDIARGRQAESLGTVYNFPKCFGLKSNDWKGFDEILRNKNDQDTENVEHVLIFLARHGQGFHNIGEEFLGSQAWKTTSSLSPDKAMHEHFPDAHLTPIGQHQADTLSRTFQHLLDDSSSPIPWPQAFYVSPLHRALETSYRTWAPLSNPARPYNPIVHDSLRERVYIEHCNRRSTRAEMSDFQFTHTTTPSSRLQTDDNKSTSRDTNSTSNKLTPTKSSPTENFNDIFTISPSSLGPFTDADDFYSHQAKSIGIDETELQTTTRAYAALTHILSQTWGHQIQYLSITTHAGFMSGVYQIFGLQHRDVPRFPTGIVVPLLIQVEKVNEPIPLADVALAGPDFTIASRGHGEAVAGKSAEEVVSEIHNIETYHRLIRLVEERRKSSGISLGQEEKNSLETGLSPLERVIVRALL